MRLGDVCAKGKSSLRQKDLRNDGPYVVFGASGIAGTSASYQNESPYVAVVKDGAGVGRARICQEQSSVLGTMQALIPNERITCKYLLHLVRSMKLGEGFSGSTIPHIYFKDYSEREVVVPALDDQEKITSTLDKIENLIDGEKTTITHLQSLAKSRFVEMFGDPKGGTRWKKAPLSTECKILTGNTPSRKCAENYGDLLEWVKTDNIRATGSIGPSSERLSTKGAEKARVVDKGAILMVCIAGSVKSIGRVGLTDRRLAFNQQINAIIPGPNYLPKYLLWAFKLSKDYLCCDINMQLKGILNKTTLSAKEYALPPLPLQREFAAFAERAAKLEFVALVQYNNQCRFQFNEGRSHDNRRDKEQSR